MSLYSSQNLYRGVNAHLHSYFQAHGKGRGFNNPFITYLCEYLDQQFPRDVRGLATHYVSESVTSLQVYEFPVRDPDLYLVAAIILPIENGRIVDAKRLLQIEILFPTNKPPTGAAHEQYRLRRNQLLLTGIPLIEIDLMHETDSPIATIPSYARNEPGAYPYRITITEQIGTKTQTIPYGFHVDEYIPTIEVLLQNDFLLKIDFEAVYQRTFHFLKVFSIWSDYAQLPDNFNTYSPADQERIKQVMERAKNVEV